MLSDKDFSQTKKEMDNMHTSLVIKKAKMEETANQLADLKREIIRAGLVEDGEEFAQMVQLKYSEEEKAMMAIYDELKKAIG